MNEHLEYGIFSDEGLLEGGFFCREDAVDTLALNYEDDDDDAARVHVHPICPDHEEEVAGHCELCDEEDGDDG